MGHHSHRSRRERDDDDDRKRSRRDRDDDHHRRRHRSRSRSPSRRHRERDDGARHSSSSHHHSSSSRRDDRDSHRSSGSSRHRHRDDDRDRDRDHSSRHESKRHRRNDDADDVEKRPRIFDDDAEAAPPAPASDSVIAGHDVSESIPTSASLDLQSRPAPSYQDDPAPLPANAPTATQIQRDDWMLDRPAAEDPGPGATSISSVDASTSAAPPAGSGDYEFFSSLGQTRSKPPPPSKPNPEQLHISSRELNQQLVQGKALDEYATEAKKETKYGAPGYQWRMMKLRKTYEQAEEEGRDVEEVAMERYGDLEGFEEAKREKDFLDGKQGKGAKAGGAMDQAKQRPALSPRASSTAAGTPMSSRSSSFKKPGEATPLTGGTPGPSSSRPAGVADRTMSMLGRSSAAGTPQSQPSTPIPSVLAPTPRPQQPASSAQPAAGDAAPAQSAPVLDAAALNKLEAKVLKAELSGKPNAVSLREKLDREKARAAQGPATSTSSGSDYFANATTSGVSSSRSDEPQVQMLPTLDLHGRLYDVGTSRAGESTPAPPLPGNRRTARKKEKHVETHDHLTGEFVRYNKDDDTQTLSELVRQEKFKAGRSDQKDFDAELASHIASDGAYREGLDYLDDNAERLARKKMKSDALKRQFAVDDYAKTRKALESCRFCYRGEESDLPPLTEATIIARGTRAYLALPETEPLVEGHCLIVPTQHHLASLEADEDTWEEVKNFAKCLLQMAAGAASTAPGGGEEQTYIFWETVTTLKAQRHTYIEAVPLPRSLAQAELPATFKSELLQSGSEWDASSSKLITFSADRPFRRSMVSQLPYFAVLFDHKGEKGYGHVIEGPDAGDVLEAAGKGGDDDGYGVDELGSKGGGSGAKFERWFAAEVVGNVLDLEPRRWRRPKRLGEGEKRRAADDFKRRWGPYDWTRMLREGATTSGGGEA